MSIMSKHVEHKIEAGGLAQFFVEHREVSWLALIAVLVWGGVADTRLGQQEDPTIPQRTAMLVTVFPGATASRVEELVAKPLERKISELKSIEEIKSTSRPGMSTRTIMQLPGSTETIDQQWDKVRAKIQEVQLPEGTRQPWLNWTSSSPILRGRCLAATANSIIPISPSRSCSWATTYEWFLSAAAKLPKNPLEVAALIFTRPQKEKEGEGRNR